MSLTPVVVSCLGQSDSSREYWIGIYKLTPTPKGTTRWYDGNPTTWTNFEGIDPDEQTACIRYLVVGYRDKACGRNFYYVCKKAAGNFCAIVILIHTIHTIIQLFSLFVVHLKYTPF